MLGKGNSNTTCLPVSCLYTARKVSSLYSKDVESLGSSCTLISLLPSAPYRVRLPTISVGYA